MELQIPIVTVDDLHQFHAKHFSSVPLPKYYPQEAGSTVQEEYYGNEGEDLGYYDDGAKRTLTDEQITMFRHSEIQRMLLERRRRKEFSDLMRIDVQPGPNTEYRSAATTLDAGVLGSPDSDQSTPMSISSGDDSHGARISEPSQRKWTVLSEKRRLKNARSRQKIRKNQQSKKWKERQIQNRVGRQQQVGEEELGEESDEWDPWHQANGPDVQKDDNVQLDY